MNKLGISLIIALLLIVVGAGGYAAYSGTTESSQLQVKAANQNCTGLNCAQNQNCTGVNCAENQNKNSKQKTNCTQNCTADGNGKHQRNQNGVNN